MIRRQQCEEQQQQPTDDHFLFVVYVKCFGRGLAWLFGLVACVASLGYGLLVACGGRRKRSDTQGRIIYDDELSPLRYRTREVRVRLYRTTRTPALQEPRIPLLLFFFFFFVHVYERMLTTCNNTETALKREIKRLKTAPLRTQVHRPRSRDVSNFVSTGSC